MRQFPLKIPALPIIVDCKTAILSIMQFDNSEGPKASRSQIWRAKCKPKPSFSGQWRANTKFEEQEGTSLSFEGQW